MAEYIFRDILEGKGGDLHKQTNVSSAGIIPDRERALLLQKGLDLPDPIFGYRPHVCVMHYLMKRGIDSSMHRSKALSKTLFDNADMVISVVDKHRDAVIKAYPAGKKKVFSLEALSKPFNLPDITNEPPGLMPPDKFCMLACDHWEFTGEAMHMIEERLNEAMDRILNFVGV